jgi:chromosome partitioning protein
MARVTVFANQKGGVSKSTTTHALSAGLIKRGFRVLVIDTDPQANLTRTMQADTKEKGLYEVLNGESAYELVQNTPHGEILSSSQQLIGADKKFADVGSEYILADALIPVKSNYDFILIDTPPQLGILTVCALVASNDVIIPITADIYAMEGLSQLASNIEKIKRRPNPELRVGGILLTRYSGRSVLSRDLKDAIEEQAAEIGTTVYKTIIREGVSIREAQAQRMSIFSYAPASNQAKDYDDFINEYLNEGGGVNG